MRAVAAEVSALGRMSTVQNCEVTNNDVAAAIRNGRADPGDRLDGPVCVAGATGPSCRMIRESTAQILRTVFDTNGQGDIAANAPCPALPHRPFASQRRVCRWHNRVRGRRKRRVNGHRLVERHVRPAREGGARGVPSPFRYPCRQYLSPIADNRLRGAKGAPRSLSTPALHG